MSSSNINTAAVTGETEFLYSKSFVLLLSDFYPLLTASFNFVDITPRPTVCHLRIDTDDTVSNRPRMDLAVYNR